MHYFSNTFVPTADPNISARFGRELLVDHKGRPVVRECFPGNHYVTCRDSLNCQVFVPCDKLGNTIPPRDIDDE